MRLHACWFNSNDLAKNGIAIQQTVLYGRRLRRWKYGFVVLYVEIDPFDSIGLYLNSVLHEGFISAQIWVECQHGQTSTYWRRIYEFMKYRALLEMTWYHGRLLEMLAFLGSEMVGFGQQCLLQIRVCGECVLQVYSTLSRNIESSKRSMDILWFFGHAIWKVHSFSLICSVFFPKRVTRAFSFQYLF